MQCQICNKNEATIHLTEISDGKRTEMHLCEECAVEQGITIKSQMPINELLGSLLASQPKDDEIAYESDKEKHCPKCGFTLKQFRKEALLGCPDDYTVFEKSLQPIIKKAHEGKAIHCGKVPSKTSRETAEEIKLVNMRQQLDAAVRAENYELAAQLRDDISKLENNNT
ncbi:MAG: UvrB/UvrC motif-containing protein [Planctomycetota bacterium]|jgi:protein arginine kinase activator